MSSTSAERTLRIRADATSATGAGHAMRMAAFVERWRQGGGGRATFSGRVEIPFVRERVARLGLGVDANGSESILVVDHYHPEVRAEGAQAGNHEVRVLVDDVGGSVPPGYDIVWNPNAYRADDLYPGFTGEIVGGPGGVPIRTGLPEWTGGQSHRIGVTLGGGPPPAMLLDALISLSLRRSDLQFTAPSAWAPEGWKKFDALDPWSELVRCSRLLTAGGSTVWEAAFVGIPIAIVVIADNQRLIADSAAGSKVPIIDGRMDVKLDKKLEAGLELARALPRIDGRAEAVVSRLLLRASAK